MTLKVLSYNIREGGGDRLPAIEAVIRNEQADAMALLEANDQAGAETLARRLGMQIAFGEANSAFHIAWLTRLSVVRWKNHRLAALAKTLLEIEVGWEGAEGTEGSQGVGGPALHLFATHLASRHDYQQPPDEVRAILDVLRPLRLAGQPHLLVGDFNALGPGDPVGDLPPGVEKRGEAVDGAPRPAIRLILEAGYVDCYRTLHPREPGYTYPTGPPGAAWLRLDYIFASPLLAARLSACDVVTEGEAYRASDHFPVWAQFD